MASPELYDQQVAQERIQALHDGGMHVAIAATGAGMGIQDKLWQVPGASRTLLDSVNPYSQAAFDNLVGRKWGDTGQSYCSPLAATALAQRAFFHAQSLANSPDINSFDVAGLGLSAAVSTDRVRRGDNKVHASIRTPHATEGVAVYMNKDLGRKVDGEIADLVGINLILHAAGIEQIPLKPDSGIESEHIEETEEGLILNPAPITPENIGQAADTVLVDIDGSVSTPQLDPEKHIIIPGSFNPMHYGHDMMARAVRTATGREPVFEITGRNIEKSATGMSELAVRALQMRGRWPVILTTTNTRFIDKVEAYSGCHFVVGYDTAERIVDSGYYDSDPQAVAQALELFAANGTIFYVVGRDDKHGVRRTVTELTLPDAHRSLFADLPGNFPISSTQLRSAHKPVK